MLERIVISIVKVENGYSVRISKFQAGWKKFLGNSKDYVAENLDSLKKLLEKTVDEFEAKEEIK
ncbi:hypothetical protein DRO19_00480 [Candidatus Bathyarchaeota archaeon]|nr:MAG: hypothetical protein DRO19_00480 [Candidatus Bathyarchaeota archaeon]